MHLERKKKQKEKILSNKLPVDTSPKRRAQRLTSRCVVYGYQLVYYCS